MRLRSGRGARQPPWRRQHSPRVEGSGVRAPRAEHRKCIFISCCSKDTAVRKQMHKISVRKWGKARSAPGFDARVLAGISGQPLCSISHSIVYRTFRLMRNHSYLTRAAERSQAINTFSAYAFQNAVETPEQDITLHRKSSSFSTCENWRPSVGRAPNQ